MNELVSIIVSCYNQAQYLDEALQSVLGQTYTNWECIIVNDGSPDNTEEVVKKWIEKDLRFKYFYKENGGLSSARNLGLNNVKGEYIQFLDSDDVLGNRKLELSIKELHLDKNINVVISNFRMFTINPDYSSAPYCTLDFEFFNFKSVLLKWESIFSIPIHCGLFSALLFQDFRFPEELKAKEDWVMWLTLFQKEFKVFFVNKSLVYYRKHQESMTNDAKYMLENHMKAIVYIRDIISEKDYTDYLHLELLQKYNETIKLKTTIYNYQNSATYKMAKKIKATFLSKYFFKIIKK
ncbi:glycosyltransferase family 2 protein [Flavobacterium lacustre]|uniref:glycosyltransferase family 2 protein n=1 Tax=Flavobacterium lacustre TaxID=3016339 RepID=UPI0022B7499B|nr:glycosyltransferase family 2 protein [Flavobacterium lacustre]